MNPRPSAPKADALPVCATLRFIADVERVYPNTAIRFNHECVCASNVFRQGDRVKSVAGGAASWRDVNRKISRMSPRSWKPRECRRRAGSPGNAGLRTRREEKCECGASRSQRSARRRAVRRPGLVPGTLARTCPPRRLLIDCAKRGGTSSPPARARPRGRSPSQAATPPEGRVVSNFNKKF